MLTYAPVVKVTLTLPWIFNYALHKRSCMLLFILTEIYLTNQRPIFLRFLDKLTHE